MSKGKDRHKRKVRRNANQSKGRVSHKAKTGRTGMIHAKKLRSGVKKSGTGRKSTYTYVPGVGLVPKEAR